MARKQKQPKKPATESPTPRSAEFVLDQDGQPVAVQVNLENWQTMLERLEDLEDLELMEDLLPTLHTPPREAGALRWKNVRAREVNWENQTERGDDESIRQAIDALAREHRPAQSRLLDLRGMEGPPGVEIRRLRVGQSRVIYALHEAENWIQVLKIRHRPPYDQQDLAAMSAAVG
jgi:mRNA-degrading endonuclease RelE of RelBE toxin-antitoxin system